MNVLSGLTLQGLILNTEENFNSIPGLSLWIDGRERVEKNASNQIQRVRDKSVQFLVFSARNQPVHEKGIWISSNNSDATLLINGRRDIFRFLHNGSRWGIYCINKNDWNASLSGGGFGPIWTSGAAGTGLQHVFLNSSNGTIGAILRRQGQTSSVRQLSNLLNPASPNFSPSGQIYSQYMVNFGQNLGVRIGYGNVVANLAPFFPNLSDYPQGQHDRLEINTGAVNMTYRGGLTLVYNWGFDFSDSQVQLFHNRIINLLNQERIKFQQADI